MHENLIMVYGNGSAIKGKYTRGSPCPTCAHSGLWAGFLREGAVVRWALPDRANPPNRPDGADSGLLPDHVRRQDFMLDLRTEDATFDE